LKLLEKYAVFSFRNYVQTDADFMFKNRVLMKVMGLRQSITREWRRLHNKDLYDQYSSPNNIDVIKSGRMGWVGHDTYG
jgi:ABC-type protease/lipase transport system fused ATPase/permease subunit